MTGLWRDLRGRGRSVTLRAVRILEPLLPATDRYPLPPLQCTESGALRRVGVELEFTGVELPAVARLLAKLLDAEAERISDYEQVVDSEDLGRFNVELDFEYLKARGRSGEPELEGLAADIEQLSEEALASIAWHLVPTEIVSPPMPLDRLSELEPLFETLREAGAKGTRSSPIYAFGLHLNPEMPSLDAARLVAYTQAFLCLHDWLVEREEVDLTRRLTPYINAFPAEYTDHVLADGYAPDREQFIDDYLAWNADRNRALDLLPLLAHLDEERVRRSIDDPRIKSRPALHYRLPNCDVDVAGWGLHVPWSHWLEVERLAADDERRAAFCHAYLAHRQRGISALLEPWWKQCDELLKSADH